MESRSLSQVASDCGGKPHGRVEGVVVRRVCTDSRVLTAGDLFVALRGDRFDGHDYIETAAERGAVGALVDSAAADNPGGLPLVVVDNTRRALGRLAANYRRDFDLCVIAVGGSNGKTTTKDLIAALLRRRFETLWSEASFNNDIGVPLTLLRLERRHRAAVFEVGTNHPGELEPLLQMVRPHIGVITSLGREHLEFFHDMTGVCREEGVLAEQLPVDGTLYFGADPAWDEVILRRTQATVVRVGFSDLCDWQVSNVRVGLEGTGFRLRGPVANCSGEYPHPAPGPAPSSERNVCHRDRRRPGVEPRRDSTRTRRRPACAWSLGTGPVRFDQCVE